MPVSFQEFQSYCNDQGVRLSHEFYMHATDYYQRFDRPNLLSAIGSTSFCFRHNPGNPLADAVLPPNEAWRNDTPASVLRSIINDSVDPQPAPEGVRNYTTTQKFVEVCGYADIAFTKTVASLRPDRKKPTALCAIHTEQGKPVLLQKSSPATFTLTAMTLSDTWIQSVKYPPGSLVSVEYPGMEDELLRKPGELSLAPPIVRPASEITGMTFWRLTPYAVTPEERPVLFGDLYIQESVRGTPAYLEIATNMTIGQIRDAAAVAVERSKG